MTSPSQRLQELAEQLKKDMGDKYVMGDAEFYISQAVSIATEACVEAVNGVKDDMVAQYNLGNVKPWNGGADAILLATSAVIRAKKDLMGE